MNLEQMKYVVQVAKENSFTKASENIHVSPSGISQSISQLEKELGVKIFNRAKKGTTLTLEGKIVLKKAMEILTKLEELPNQILALNHSINLNLRVGFPPAFGHIVYDAFLAFKKKHPTIKVELKETLSANLIKSFKLGLIDLGVMVGQKEELENHSEFEVNYLYQSHICVCVGKHSPFRFFDSITAQDLINQNLAIFENESYIGLLSNTNLTNNEVLLSTNNGTVLKRVLYEGDAVTFTDNFTFKNFSDVHNGTFFIVPFKDPDYIYRDFWSIHSKDKGVSVSAREFLEHIKVQLR